MLQSYNQKIKKRQSEQEKYVREINLLVNQPKQLIRNHRIKNKKKTKIKI